MLDYPIGDQLMTVRIRFILGASLVAATLAAAGSMGAERSTPNDTPDTKISVVPEPTESPRYLRDR